MSKYNIPKDCDELFLNGNAFYVIEDSEKRGDNVFGMKIFLESVGVPDEVVEFDEGTRVILSRDGKRIQIDSGGLGDFSSHGFEVKLFEQGGA